MCITHAIYVHNVYHTLHNIALHIYINKSKSFSKKFAKFSGKFIKALRAFGWACRAPPLDPKAADLEARKCPRSGLLF